jgi:hypothetical protein
VRPDQYIAHVLPLDAYTELASFFDGFTSTMTEDFGALAEAADGWPVSKLRPRQAKDPARIIAGGFGPANPKAERIRTGFHRSLFGFQPRASCSAAISCSGDMLCATLSSNS